MKNLLIIIILSVSINSTAQTVGLLFNDSLSFNGYTLFSPSNSGNTYLIDNCGFEVHRWTSEYDPGNSVYLLENGNLMRTAKVPSGVFNGGGIGGFIEEFDWDGNLIWSFDYSNDLVHQHHDIEVLPNGNILVLAWENISIEEAISKGRDPFSLTGDNLWPDHIVEVEKVGTEGGNIVWEWHSWDHLIQDFDETKENFGVIADHPELIDVNFTWGGGGAGGNADWMHCNAVAYNEALDQIVVSSRSFSEIWIIDHTTTSEEAAGHEGGIYGKGGDLLYRYGNPQVYDRGTLDDQIFGNQHDVDWIPVNYPQGGKIIVFNNNADTQASAVDIIDPPMVSPGIYAFPGEEAYGPAELDWRYMAPGFYATHISGVHPQPNGNFLVCEGPSGSFFEVTQEQEVVWEYINPIATGGPVSQGTNPNQNSVFRAQRYGPEYGAFVDKDLTPGDPLELNPTASDCIIHDGTSTGIAENNSLKNNFEILNPIQDELIIWNRELLEVDFRIFNLTGDVLLSSSTKNSATSIDASSWSQGMYVIAISEKKSGLTSSYKIVKSDN